MDKYEYKLKTGQMLELMEDGAFNKAAEIADSIDWKRVRNTKMLTDVSDIYERNGDYQKSYEVLNIAYHRAEGSRKIIYRLCTLALKTKNVDEAIDYYDDFQQIAPKDPNKFILRYQILRAQRAPIEQQIEALEEFKKAEYIEEWAYELAKRYQEAGMTAECLEECDDLILWFNEGKYVYQAMELKMQYKPLTPSQQEKYDQRYAAMSNETIEMPNVAEYVNEQEAAAKAESGESMPVSSERATEDTVGEPVQEPKKRETKGRKIGSTMKLDEALKSLLNLGMGEEDKVKDSSSEPVSTDVVFEEDKFKEALEEIEAVADLDLIDEISNQKGLRELKVDPDLEELLPDSFADDSSDADIQSESLEFNTEKTLEELYADAGTPLEVPDPDIGQMGTGVSGDTKIIGTGLGGDTRVLDKEALQTLAGLDSGYGGTDAGLAVKVPEEQIEELSEEHTGETSAEPEIIAGKAAAEPKEKLEEVIPELDEEAREIIAELDEEARKTIEELEEEPDTEDYHIVQEKAPAAEYKDQVEGQMNLLDLMADIEMPDIAEEPETGKTEQYGTGGPILPLDIQRMIDEIEGVIPAEDSSESLAAEAAAEQEEPAPEEEPHENMGAVAAQLRVDESSEMFEDYDDVLDEEEYPDSSAGQEAAEGTDEEYTEDIRISFGREQEESSEEFVSESGFGEIMKEEGAGERLTIEYQESDEFGLEEENPDAKSEYGYAEPEYEDAVYTDEEPQYTDSEAGYEEDAYIGDEPGYTDAEPEYEDAAYIGDEPEYTDSGSEYEEAVYDRDELVYDEASYGDQSGDELAYDGGYDETESSDIKSAYESGDDVESFYENEYADTEMAYENEYADGEPAYENDYADSESAYEDEYADSEPVYENEYTDSESVYEDEYADSEPAYENEYADSESVYEDEYADSKPAYENEYAGSESTYEDEYAGSESTYEDEYADSESSYEDEYADSEPSYEDEYAESESVYEDEYADSESAYENGYANNESVYEDEYADSESAYEDEYAESEPVYEDEYADSEPSYENEYAESESVYEDEYADSELIYENEHADSESVYEDEYADSESAYEEGYEESEPAYENQYDEFAYEDEYEDTESIYGEGLEEGGAFYDDIYGDDEYEETSRYEGELDYDGEYDSEYEYEDRYEDEEYYAEDEYEEEEFDAASVEARLEDEFRPQKRSRKHFDEREVPEEEEEIDILSATTPLSRKETAKLIATGKTAPLPMDEISDALSMSDTGFVVHGRYDLRTQSGIGTRAGLTEEQKKLFSYFVPVRGMSEQLVDVLEQDKNCTNRKGTSNTGNLLIIGNKGNGKTVLAVDVVKAIQRQRNIRQGRVAIVTGDSLNKKKISDIFSKLYGGALIIEKAGKMNEKTVARVNKAMERETGELLIVLEDQRKPLDRLLTSNREFRRKFTSRLEVPILINDELVTFGQTYAQENGYQIDEMGILALYSRIDMLQREDHAVTIAEVKEVMDEAMEHSQKASAKKLVKRVLGKNRDDSDRIILTERDFI